MPVTVHSEDGEQELQYIKPDIEEYKGSGKGASNPGGSASTGPPVVVLRADPGNRSVEGMLRTIINTQGTILELLDRLADRLGSDAPEPHPWHGGRSRPAARSRSPRRRG